MKTDNFFEAWAKEIGFESVADCLLKNISFFSDIDQEFIKKYCEKIEVTQCQPTSA